MKTKINKLSTGLVIFGLIPFNLHAQQKEARNTRPNILFIAVDDLRPELGCYGQTHIKSPNIDRLAGSGVVFTNAYSNFPRCGPSRASLLSGIYTSNSRLGPGNISQDEHLPGVVSLPMHFRNNNYKTIALGKIYHDRIDAKGSWDINWNPPVTTDRRDYHSTENIKIIDEQRNSFSGAPNALAYEKPDVPDLTYFDGKIANRAIEELWNLQNNPSPFFLAVGFNKPHLPFNAPLKYWNLYEENDIKLPSNNLFPENAPDEAYHNSVELRNYHGIPDGQIPDTLAKKLIHGYYACVSYIDAQIGLILFTLEFLGLADNTIVILWGDHGFLLGEHSMWTKHSNFKKAAHSPLILKVPWKNSGIKTDALVDFVDIYPTLCELAGLPLPFHLQGRSFVPLINNPDLPWKEAIFYRMTQGETIITKTHSYTEWIDYGTKQTVARMLYDLRKDPEENNNISEIQENKTLMENLSKKLHVHMEERDKIILP